MLKYDIINDDNSINTFCALAAAIWHEYFPFLLSAEQIDYMLAKFQSPEAVKLQQQEGYQYYFIKNDDNIVGYVVFKPEKDCLFLSKLYFIKENRGKGFGRQALAFLIGTAKKQNLNKIQLTVNKYNDNSIAAYKKWGFDIAKSKVFDIGSGYVMDDYIMEKQV